MGRRATGTGWFETLRRESVLFAWVAACLLVVNLLQPLVAAQAAGMDGWVICTAGGVDGAAADAPAADPAKCPICLGAHACCPAAPLPAGLDAGVAAHPALIVFAASFVHDDDPPPARRPGVLPPGIRAPPASI